MRGRGFRCALARCRREPGSKNAVLIGGGSYNPSVEMFLSGFLVAPREGGIWLFCILGSSLSRGWLRMEYVYNEP